KAECHSTFTQTQGIELQTVEGARRTLIATGTIRFDPSEMQTAKDTTLYLSLTKGVSSREGLTGLVRMPYDAPMPNDDVYLILDWLQEGAEGAQCVPGQGTVCNGSDGYTCTDDGNFGELVSSGDCL